MSQEPSNEATPKAEVAPSAINTEQKQVTLNATAASFVPKSTKSGDASTKNPKTTSPVVLPPPFGMPPRFGMPPFGTGFPGVPPMFFPPAGMVYGQIPPPTLNVKQRPAIILIVGDACSGKTTLAERVAKDHNLIYFCGARVLQTYANQGKSEWDKRALVVSAIEAVIKDAYAPGCTFRGVIIDRQGKSIDDIYYLNAMLRKNAWHITAVFCCVVKDDAILAQRMRAPHGMASLEDHIIAERIRASRYLVERAREIYAAPGLLRDIDTSGKEDTVARHLRGEIGSLLAAKTPLKLTQYPTPPPPPSESRFQWFVEDVDEYAEVLTNVFRLLQKDRFNKFPGSSVGTYLTSDKVKQLTETLQAKDSTYAFRQLREGTPYLLYQSSKNSKVYLIGRHLRCAYHLDVSFWKKFHPKDFILEGELVCDVTGSDIFYVTDCLAVQGKPCLRRSWAERQKYIGDLMVPDEDAFAPIPGRVTFLRHTFVDFDRVRELVAIPNIRGVIMQPTQEYHSGVDEKMLCWYPPTALALDLRVRVVETTPVDGEEADGPRRIHLDCLSLDSDIARYVDTGIVVDVSNSRVVVAYGNIVEVTLAASQDGTKAWSFRRVRYDRTQADTKSRVETVVGTSPVSVEAFLQFTTHVQSVQEQERKKYTYQGDDVLKKLLEMKHALELPQPQTSKSWKHKDPVDQAMYVFEANEKVPLNENRRGGRSSRALEKSPEGEQAPITETEITKESTRALENVRRQLQELQISGTGQPPTETKET